MMESLRRGNKPERQLMRVRVKEIRLNPYQPRNNFDEAAIEGLAESIRENGLISPITLRRLPQGGYGLIAGERRLRALRLLGMGWTDAVVMDADETQTRAMSLIENIQRENLSFFEEARAVRELLRATGETQDAIARRLGRSPSFVANRLRILRLPDEVQGEIRSGELTERHARALLMLNAAPEKQLFAAREAARKSLTVRETEQLVQRLLAQKPKPGKPPKTVIRDRRIFVNAFKDTVKRLTEAGVNVAYRVEEDEDAVSVIVSLPKNASASQIVSES